MQTFRWVSTLLLLALAPIGVQADGGNLDLARYEGKVVYLDFWASWCVPCRRSFPWMNAMQAKYADDGLVIVSVNVDAEPELAAKFLEETPADFEVVYDPKGTLASEWELLGMPNSFIIGRDGNIVGKHVGFRSDTGDKLEGVLKELLAAPASNDAEVAR